MANGWQNHRSTWENVVNPTTGGGERTRTADFYIANVALYQLSYTPWMTHENSRRHRGRFPLPGPGTARGGTSGCSDRPTPATPPEEPRQGPGGSVVEVVVVDVEVVVVEVVVVGGGGDVVVVVGGG